MRLRSGFVWSAMTPSVVLALSLCLFGARSSNAQQEVGIAKLALVAEGADVRLTVQWTVYPSLFLNIGTSCRDIPVVPNADGSRVFSTVLAEKYLSETCGLQYMFDSDYIKLSGKLQLQWRTSNRNQNVFVGTITIVRALTSTSSLGTSVGSGGDQTTPISSSLAVCNDPAATYLRVPTNSDVCLNHSIEVQTPGLYVKSVAVRLLGSDGTFVSELTPSVSDVVDGVAHGEGVHFTVNTGDATCTLCRLIVSTLLGAVGAGGTDDGHSYVASGSLPVTIYSSTPGGTTGISSGGGNVNTGVAVGAGAAAFAGVAGAALIIVAVRRRRRSREHAARLQAPCDDGADIREARIQYADVRDVSERDDTHNSTTFGHIGELSMFGSASIGSLPSGSLGPHDTSSVSYA